MNQNQKLLLCGLAAFSVFFLGCPPAELTSARVYLNEENYEKAEEFLLKTIEIAPDNAEAPALLGNEIYGRRQEWNKMNNMFEKALAINPQEKMADGLNVEQYIKNNRYFNWTTAFNNAIIEYNKVINFTGDDRRSAMQDVMPLFEASKNINPSESQTYPVLATVYFEAGDTAQAIDALDIGYELAPDELGINHTSGQIYLRLGEIDKAVDFLSKAAELDPGNSKIIRQLANVYYDLGRTEQSITTFEDAISKEEDNKIKADLYYNLGILNMEMGEFDSAEDNFYWANDLNPDDTEALLRMAQVFERAEKWRKAEKFYRELIAEDPDVKEYYLGMVRVLVQQGKPEEAQRYLEKSKRAGD